MMRLDRDFPGHFVGAKNCRFFLTTDVGDYRISTVGDYWPMHSEQREDIGFDRSHETMVFHLSDEVCTCGCGAREVADWSNIDFDAYHDDEEATHGHERMVQKYLTNATTPTRGSDE